METYTQPSLIATSAILRSGSGADPCPFPLSVFPAPCASFAFRSYSSVSCASSASFASSASLNLPASPNNIISIHLGSKAPRFLKIARSQQKSKLKRSQLIENKQPASLQIATKLRFFQTNERAWVRGA
jgi:hypothetical protein